MLTEWLRVGFEALAFLLSVTALIYARFDRKDEQLLEVYKRINQLEQNDARLSGGPTHNDLAALRSTVADLSRGLASLEGALGANTRMVERMNQFLMEKGT